jgi:hypothetical protein
MHMPFKTKPAYEVVHAVQAPQRRALAAARRADEGRDFPFLDGNVAVAHRAKLAIVYIVDVAIDDSAADMIVIDGTVAFD